MWNGSDNTGAPGLRKRSHCPTPPVVNTPSVPARRLKAPGTSARISAWRRALEPCIADRQTLKNEQASRGFPSWDSGSRGAYTAGSHG